MRPPKRSRNGSREQVHVAGADDQLDAAALEPVGHRRVPRRPVGVVVELEDGRLDAGRLGALERPHAGPVRGDRDDREARVEQRLQVRPGAGDEHADHPNRTPSPGSTAPITSPSPASPAGTTAQKPIPQLKTRSSSSSSTPCSASQSKTGGRSQACGSIRAPSPSGRTRARLPRDPAAGHVGERAHVGPRAQRPHLVEVEPRRRQEEVGVEGAVADERAHEREAVRVDARRTRSRARRRPPRSGSRRSAARARRCRRRCRRSRAPPRGRSRAARRSRRRAARSRRRGRPPPRPRRARRAGRGRPRSRPRSRGRTAARRRS